MGNADNKTSNSKNAFYIACIAVVIYAVGSFIPAIGHSYTGEVNLLVGIKDNDITSILVLASILANVAAILIKNKTAITLSGFVSFGVILYAIINIVQTNEQISASPFAAFAGGELELLPGIFIMLAASIMIIIAAVSIKPNLAQSTTFEADGEIASGEN